MFYGRPRTTAARSPTADVLTNGNITWSGPGGDATGVATDQQGTGTVYQYFWPCCGGGDTNFFQVNGAGRDLRPAPGERRPARRPTRSGRSWAGANFAVNPVNGDQIVISSSTSGGSSPPRPRA